MVANAPSASTTCSAATLQGRTGNGAWGAVASGNTAIRLTGANLNGGANCAVTVNVTANSTAKYTNTTDTFYSDNGGTIAPETAALDVLGPPQITKSFSPTVIALRSGNNNYSTLTITITNPTTATTGLTGVTFTDIFPTDMTVRTGGQGKSNTCGGDFTGSADGGVTWNSANTTNGGDTAIRLTGGSLAANGTCTLTIRVQGRSEGLKVNTIPSVTASNGGTGGGTSASLWVGSPTVVKDFTCTQPIVAGAVCQYMTLAITAPATIALAAPQITDIFPLETLTGGGFTLFDTTWSTQGSCPSGGGAFTVQGRTGSGGSWGPIAAGNTAIRATATGNITSGNTCTLRFRVTSNTNATNIIPVGGLTGTLNGYATSNAVAASAILQVYEPPTLDKSFAAPSVLVNGSTTMNIELSQVNNVTANTVEFTDAFPGETVAGTGSPIRLTNGTVTNTCGGTLQGRTGSSGSWTTPAAGHTALRLSGSATISAVSDCTITVNVTGHTAGSYTNTISQAKTTNIGNSNADSATLVVMAAPTVAKAFTPSTITAGDYSLLTVTLTNPNTTAITGAAFTDTYPANVVNFAIPNASSSCGGTLTAAAGGGSLALSGGTIPASGSCSVSVRVTSATSNLSGYINTLAIGAVTSSNAGSNAAAASATLIVNPLYPQLNLVKQVSVYSDPINNLTNPKAIPGATMTYVVRVTNTGPGTVDAGTLKISDQLPAEVDLYVGVGVPSTPLAGFTYTNGTPVSGLTACTFGNKNTPTDCVEFSTDGSTWTYAPAPDADGFDSAARYIRFVPQGPFNAAGGSGNPWAEFSFKVRVK
jgi:uncharacterized repeat protein (TIGR01451 family)